MMPLFRTLLSTAIIVAAAACSDPQCQPDELKVGTVCRDKPLPVDADASSGVVTGAARDGATAFDARVRGEVDGGSARELADAAVSDADDACPRADCAPGDADASHDERVQQLAPKHWFRADSIEGSAAAVEGLTNRVAGGSDKLVMRGLPVAQEPSAAWKGQSALRFTGSSAAESDQASSAFSYLHDATGCDLFLVVACDNTVGVSQNYVLGTLRTSQPTFATGINIALAQTLPGPVGQLQVVIANASATSPVNTLPPQSASLAMPTYVEVSYGATGVGPNFVAWARDTLLVSAGSAAQPSAGAPAFPLQLGNDAGESPGTGGFKGLFADLIMFDRVLSTEERSIVQAYVAARYGL